MSLIEAASCATLLMSGGLGQYDISSVYYRRNELVDYGHARRIDRRIGAVLADMSPASTLIARVLAIAFELLPLALQESRIKHITLWMR